ncbi:site-2 protease family protein [Nocardia sp. NBC_01730]|uniref:site-2 protease family protein n=1 Tax=Nocardia sp. NBC_01730 TaxID=2975998 RepID=UPI002E100013|nr:site-2 protease family protein [Nocardia sp. NBC_01730]
MVAFGAAVAAAVVDPGGPITGALVWLAVMNAVLGVFNLLPGAPLDGGRVLRATIWWRTGDRLRAATTAARSGQILGTVLLMIGVAELIVFGYLAGLWLMLLGWFLQSAAHAELTVAGLRHRFGDSRVRELMTRRPMAVPHSACRPEAGGTRTTFPRQSTRGASHDIGTGHPGRTSADLP